MLSLAQKIFEEFNIDFYLVGAVARDVQFSEQPGLASLRKTNDVDVALMINDEGHFYEIKNALLATGHFTEHKTEPIKLFYKHAIEFDLLPFGEIENEAHEITLHKPRLFVMDMPGFREALSYKNVIEIDDDFKLHICSLEGLVLLKLFAYGDKPERTKDISDIGHILTAYFDLCSDEIYENNVDVMDLYDTANPKYLSLIASRIIGRKIKMILSGDQALIRRIKLILAKRPTEEWNAIGEGLEE
jgi:predicted nucleotidyltransferase